MRRIPDRRNLRAALTHERWLAGARRAPRALEDVKKVLTDRELATCPTPTDR
jgi:hypothetical protein